MPLFFNSGFPDVIIKPEEEEKICMADHQGSEEGPSILVDQSGKGIVHTTGALENLQSVKMEDNPNEAAPSSDTREIIPLPNVLEMF
ncbi:hypothetical protein JD844_013612 [Phrynosoma platyrhinos]|uniref:Uncharacterized protein n=1 Tax=Phrynosoma platyrhinos TaxID=52577 RepID=A0ABQ7TL58_PHRPL|nr:hypothetical protein JD844_013612 [Phrynosoma platyrhinos]